MAKEGPSCCSFPCEHNTDDIYVDEKASEVLVPAGKCICHKPRARPRFGIARIVLELTLCASLLAAIAYAYTLVHNHSMCAPVLTKFGSNVEYMSLSHEFDHLWDGEMGAKIGVINLASVGPDGEQMTGAIAMFHQLHCLTSIRKALQKAHEGVDIGIDYNDDYHWPHCLHYLRESILCAADPTIELPRICDVFHPANESKVGSHGVVDGAWDIRACRNADSLYELFAERGVEQESGGQM